jgi:hypothetical protein
MSSELTPELLATLRRMIGAEKLQAAAALYWSARRLKAAAVREQHPEWTEEQIRRRVNEIFLRNEV